MMMYDDEDEDGCDPFSPCGRVSLQRLLQHVEERLVGCLAHRCSVGVLRDIRDAQRHMIGTTSHCVHVCRHKQAT